MERSLLRHGFLLILLALLGAFLVPLATLPRLAVAAHTIGVLSGLLLLLLGVIWPQFRLRAGQLRLLKWSWLLSSYLNWLACLVGAQIGAGGMTPVAAMGQTGSAAAELAIAISLISVALISLLAVGLSLWGLRGKTAT
jgi:hydroxylaminobenzene mutase